MKKSILLLLVVLMASSIVTAQTKIHGVTLSPKIAPGKVPLVLNGGGIRTKLFLKLYVAGLYLQEKTTDAKKVIAQDKHMAVRINITSGVLTSENMAEAIREGFDKSTKNNSAPFQKQIDLVCKIFLSEEVKVGDRYEIYYVPGTGVKCNKNGKDQGMNIPGLAFKKVLFGIWFSDDPVDADLKEGMLGLD